MYVVCRVASHAVTYTSVCCLQEKEMERREQARLDMLEKKRMEQDERIQRALERAKDPPFKRVCLVARVFRYARVIHTCCVGG